MIEKKERMGKYLNGEPVEINTPSLRKVVGKKVEYLRKVEVTRRGIGSSIISVIESVERKNIFFKNGDTYHFSQIAEIVLVP